MDNGTAKLNLIAAGHMIHEMDERDVPSYIEATGTTDHEGSQLSEGDRELLYDALTTHASRLAELERDALNRGMVVRATRTKQRRQDALDLRDRIEP